MKTQNTQEKAWDAYKLNQSNSAKIDIHTDPMTLSFFEKSIRYYGIDKEGQDWIKENIATAKYFVVFCCSEYGAEILMDRIPVESQHHVPRRLYADIKQDLTETLSNPPAEDLTPIALIRESKAEIVFLKA